MFMTFFDCLVVYFTNTFYQHDWPNDLSGRHAVFYCAKCYGFKSHMEQYFVCTVNCCSVSGWFRFMYVCKVPRDTKCIFLMQELSF